MINLCSMLCGVPPLLYIVTLLVQLVVLVNVDLVENTELVVHLDQVQQEVRWVTMATVELMVIVENILSGRSWRQGDQGFRNQRDPPLPPGPSGPPRDTGARGPIYVKLLSDSKYSLNIYIGHCKMLNADSDPI